MNPSVQVLPQTLINKIAAGEVIVRPASVVKELVENSFDAGARHIRVEVSQDGRSISVQDDGCGMDEENAKRAILRHSTSKIRDFEDLERLSTRGFRGEALASIISVSRFEMLARAGGGTLSGTRLVAAGGKVERVEPAGTAPGVVIHVRDLFYNTPARLKFLKNPAAEFNAAVEILTQQALSRPDVGIACVRAGQVRFDLPPGQSPLERIESLLGSAVHGKMLRVFFERGGFSVRGFIARPEAARKDRRWQYLLVNGRPISAKQLSYPIQEAYQGLLMKQRFPVVVLDIHIEPTEVDVNVHPTKEEVRFQDERQVAGLLYRAVSQTLHENNLIPTITVAPGKASGPEKPVSDSSPEETPPVFPGRQGGPGGSASSRRASESPDPSLPFLFSPKGVAPFSPGSTLKDFARSPSSTRDLFPTAEFMPPASRTTGPTNPADQPESAASEGRALPGSSDFLAGGPVVPRAPDDLPWPEHSPFSGGPLPTPLGQIARTYIVAEWGDDLLLIDQHAAHERLLYRRLLDRPAQACPSQPLLVPIPVEVPPGDLEPLEALLPVLRETGIEIEKGEGNQFLVTALPSDFDGVDAAGVTQDVLDDLRASSGATPLGLDALRDKVLVRMACHAAIKSGQALSRAEMEALIREVAAAQLSFTCPHGRPIMVTLRKDHLDRQFGRKQ